MFSFSVSHCLQIDGGFLVYINSIELIIHNIGDNLMSKPKNTEEWLENLRKTIEKIKAENKKKTTTRKKSAKKETE